MDVYPSKERLAEVKKQGIDVLSFVERSWCFEYYDKPSGWSKSTDNVAIAVFNDYKNWLWKLPEETESRLDRARKARLEVKVVNPKVSESVLDERKAGYKLAEGIWRIYNETPVRQGRSFLHYGVSLEQVQRHVFSTSNLFLGAYLLVVVQRKLVGFAELEIGEETGAFAQILSLISYRHVMPNNALIAKAVEVCAERGCYWLVYGRMGNHPSLDRFKESNNFQKQVIKRYYVPLSLRGKVAVALGLHRDLKDAVPERLKGAAVPAYNWVSRLKAKAYDVGHRLRS